jgi:predicted transcriptional regulator
MIFFLRPVSFEGGVMEDKRVTAEEILAELNLDVRQMAETVADAINGAEAGEIINQSEEQVRDAHAVLRKATYQKALSLLEKNQRAFSPSAESSRDQLE